MWAVIWFDSLTDILYDVELIVFLIYQIIQ